MSDASARSRDSFQHRLQRSVPGLGLLATLLHLGPRLAEEAAEDAAYRAMMERLGESPKYPHASEVGERWLIGAEVAAHLAAALAGATAVRSGIPIAAVFPATWIVAFALDFGLGRAAVRLYGRTLSRADEG